MFHCDMYRDRRGIGKVCVRGISQVTSDNDVTGGVRIKDVELKIGILAGIECHP